MANRCQHCTILIGQEFIEKRLRKIHGIEVCDSCYEYLSSLRGVEVYNWRRKFRNEKKDYARI